VLAAYLGDGVISLGSLVGFLTILGSRRGNGIMLIDHFQHLERHEGETFGPGLVLRGARERISPIMMTALTSALAILPLVVAGSIPERDRAPAGCRRSGRPVHFVVAQPFRCSQPVPAFWAPES
jgi:multidrug efflux pump subunit AcrB